MAENDTLSLRWQTSSKTSSQSEANPFKPWIIEDHCESLGDLKVTLTSEHFQLQQIQLHLKVPIWNTFVGTGMLRRPWAKLLILVATKSTTSLSSGTGSHQEDQKHKKRRYVKILTITPSGRWRRRFRWRTTWVRMQKSLRKTAQMVTPRSLTPSNCATGSSSV